MWRFMMIVMALCAVLQSAHGTTPKKEGQMDWSIGGAGGAYFLATPGELEVEVFKRDLDLQRQGSEVRGILSGPDRQILGEVVIPASGGEVQRAVLKAQVPRTGIYALMIHIRDDRYGTNLAWGMRTNAAAYVVETSRGHRDERHQEPIVLLDADRPSEVCFLPRAEAFEIEVEGLPADVKQLALYDETGVQVAEIPVVQAQSTAIRQYLRMRTAEGVEGSAKYMVPGGAGRGHALWRLHVPRGQAFVNIDGVTRWERGDRYPDLSVWTPDPNSWFAFLEHRWMISPYQRTVWVAPDEKGQMAFQVHNNAAEQRVFALSLEFPGAAWPAGLSEDRVVLQAGEARTVTVSYAAPAEGKTLVCHVRATPEQHPEVTTYATLTVHGGEAPVKRTLNLPLVLAPYAHENRQLGYLPDYPVDNQVYFDLENRPYMVTEQHLYRQVGDAWVATRISEAVVKRVPEFQASSWSVMGTKIAFDADNDLYLLGRSGSTVALLHSTDGGETFAAYAIAGREEDPRSWDFEQFSGKNVPSGPPPVVRLTRMQPHSEGLRWRTVNDLELIVGEKTDDGQIVFGEPMLLSKTSLGFSMHSGIPSAVVSRGSKVHVAWGEATDPAVSRDEIPGVPAYVITYDRETGLIGEPVFMSFGPPPNDGHNTPSITMDSKGYIHVVVGTHGRPFQYLCSLKPNDAYGGWTEATRTSADDLRQTYVGFLCGADDVLHLVFRLWRSDEAHLNGASWASLAYQRKLPGQDWEAPKLLVAAPLSEYSIYYHRLTVDRKGTLFLSYDYWSTMWFYRNDQRGDVAAGSGRAGRGWGRALLTSKDQGDAWQLWQGRE